MSNANLVKNADDLLSKKNADVSVESIRKDCLKTDTKCPIEFFLVFENKAYTWILVSDIFTSIIQWLDRGICRLQVLLLFVSK